MSSRLWRQASGFIADLFLAAPSYLDTSPSRPSTSLANASSPSSSAEDSQSASSSPSSSSPDYSAPSNKPVVAARPGRPPKDPAAREKKRAKKAANTALSRVQGGGGEGEGGLHVCVTVSMVPSLPSPGSSEGKLPKFGLWQASRSETTFWASRCRQGAC